MDRLSEIRARCERAQREDYPEKIYGCAAYYCVNEDIPYLLAEVDKWKYEAKCEHDHAAEFMAENDENKEMVNLWSELCKARWSPDKKDLMIELEKLTARAKKAEAGNRWISVRERLPDEGEYRDTATGELIPVLVCVDGTEYPFRAFYDGKSWGDGWSRIPVTHWRPLPEPPEEGDQS